MKIYLMKRSYVLLFFLAPSILLAQHNFELNLEGGSITIEAGATVYVWGDVRMDDDGLGNNAAVNNSGTIEVQGHWYDEHTNATQSGTGLVWFHNNDVNSAEQQQIICTGGANLTASAAFYDIDVDNNHATDKLLFLNGGNAEVKNSVEFMANNRIRTAPVSGADGSVYAHYFHTSNTNPATSIINPGTAGGTVSYFEGRLRRSVITANNYDFLVGIDPANVVFGNQIANVNLTGAVGGGTVIEGSFTRDAGGAISGAGASCGTVVNCKIDHGYWNLDLISGSVAQYTETDYPRNYVSACDGSIGDYVILKRPNGGSLNDFGSSYTDIATDGNTCFDGTGNASASVLTVTRTGFSSFSDHGIGRGMGAFPIELSSFTGHAVGNRNLLLWTTVSETNADHFEVERAADGANFSKIEHNVPAVGNSTQELHYNLYDNLPLFGKNYYRLKSIDIDGTYKHSNIIEIWNGDLFANVYPNPFSEEVFLEIPMGVRSAEFILYDAIGRVISQKTWGEQNRIDASISSANWASGTYLYRLFIDGKNIQNGKLIKN